MTADAGIVHRRRADRHARPPTRPAQSLQDGHPHRPHADERDRGGEERDADEAADARGAPRGRGHDRGPLAERADREPQRPGRRPRRLPVREEPRRGRDQGRRRQPTARTIPASPTSSPSATTAPCRSSATPTRPGSGRSPSTCRRCSTRARRRPACAATTCSARTPTAPGPSSRCGVSIAAACPTWPSAAWRSSPPSITAVLDAYLGTAAGVAPTPHELAGHGLRLPRRRRRRRAGRTSPPASAPGARKDTLITDATSRRATSAIRRCTPGTPTGCARSLLGSRHDLIYPRRPLQRQQRARRRLRDDDGRDRARGLVGRPDQHARRRRRLPLRLQHRRRGRDPRRDRAAGLGRGVRAQGRDAVAGTGYQYGDTDFLEYSERLYADFAQQLRTGHRRGAGRPGAGEGQAGLPGRRRRRCAASTEGAAGGDALRAADAELNLPAGRISRPSTTLDRRRPRSRSAAAPGDVLGLRYANVSHHARPPTRRRRR